MLSTLSPQGCGESTLQCRVRKQEGFACRTTPPPAPSTSGTSKVHQQHTGGPRDVLFSLVLKMSNAFKILFLVIYSMSGPGLSMLEITAEAFRASSIHISRQARS